jgi:hypothetical protein
MQSVRKKARLRSPSISSVQTEDYKKLKIEAQILYECMLLMTEKLEETVDVYAPTLHEKTRMLIKKELKEVHMHTIVLFYLVHCAYTSTVDNILFQNCHHQREFIR